MTHLHRDDYPDTLAVLDALLGHRDPERVADIGYLPDGSGADVDWERLESSWLSTTERAAVRVAHAASTVEAHGGGFPDKVKGPIKTMVDHLTTT
jgi:hypothetical protein